MEDLFEKFRKDEDEKDDMPFRKKKKFKKNMGMEKPEPEDMEDDDPDIEDLVERMAGASASAGRSKKNRGKKPPFPIRKKKDEEK